ncbi:hypothetical protein IFM47457_10802 [Aspergillus lentulus]|nr:hypothetical protein IFM47457_10802 [Aspergillus lentulus]
MTRKSTQIGNFITSVVVAPGREAHAHSEIHHQSPEPARWSGKESVSTEGGVSKWNEGIFNEYRSRTRSLGSIPASRASLPLRC